MMFGDEFTSRLIQQKSSCRKCGTEFTFEEGGSLAIENGIKDQVVVCPKCHSVYEVNLTPRSMSLLSDVSERYSLKSIASPIPQDTSDKSLSISPDNSVKPTVREADLQIDTNEKNVTERYRRPLSQTIRELGCLSMLVIPLIMSLNSLVNGNTEWAIWAGILIFGVLSIFLTIEIVRPIPPIEYLKRTRDVERIIKLLNIFPPKRRIEAAQALGELRDARAIEPLVKASGDKNNDVAAAATSALINLGWEPRNDLERARVAVLTKQWDKAVQLGAATTFHLTLVDNDPFPDIDFVIYMQQRGKNELMDCIPQQLWVNNEEYADYLIQFSWRKLPVFTYSDGSKGYRWAYGVTFRDRRKDRVTGRKEFLGTFPPTGITIDPRAVRRTGDSGEPPDFQEVKKYLRSQLDKLIRVPQITPNSLRTSTGSTLNPSPATASSNESEHVRNDAEVASKKKSIVSKMKEQSDVTGLIEMLQHEDWGLRGRAVEALGDLGDKQAINPLLEVLKRDVETPDNFANVLQELSAVAGKLADPDGRLEVGLKLSQEAIEYRREVIEKALTQLGYKVEKRTEQYVKEEADELTTKTDRDDDTEFLQVETISRRLMNLLWLDPQRLAELEEKLIGRNTVMLAVGHKGDNSDLVEYDYTREDYNWAKEIERLIDKAHSAGLRGDFAKSIHYYKEGLKLAPGCDLFLMSVGAGYAELGEIDRGLRFLTRAAEISPENTRIKDNLDVVAQIKTHSKL